MPIINDQLYKHRNDDVYLKHKIRELEQQVADILHGMRHPNAEGYDLFSHHVLELIADTVQAGTVAKGLQLNSNNRPTVQSPAGVYQPLAYLSDLAVRQVYVVNIPADLNGIPNPVVNKTFALIRASANSFPEWAMYTPQGWKVTGCTYRPLRSVQSKSELDIRLYASDFDLSDSDTRNLAAEVIRMINTIAGYALSFTTATLNAAHVNSPNGTITNLDAQNLFALTLRAGRNGPYVYRYQNGTLTLGDANNPINILSQGRITNNGNQLAYLSDFSGTLMRVGEVFTVSTNVNLLPKGSIPLTNGHAAPIPDGSIALVHPSDTAAQYYQYTAADETWRYVRDEPAPPDGKVNTWLCYYYLTGASTYSRLAAVYWNPEAVPPMTQWTVVAEPDDFITELELEARFAPVELRLRAEESRYPDYRETEYPNPGGPPNGFIKNKPLCFGVMKGHNYIAHPNPAFYHQIIRGPDHRSGAVFYHTVIRGGRKGETSLPIPYETIQAQNQGRFEL